MNLIDNQEYYTKLGFEFGEFTDKNCSSDKWDTLFFKDYTKTLLYGQLTLQVCFGYEVDKMGNRKLFETSVCIYGNGCDIETKVSTTDQLSELLNSMDQMVRFFK